MNQRVYVPTRGPVDWRARLADPQKHWRQGYSAHAVAQAWERAAGLPPEIAQLFDPAPELLLAIPEHGVALPGRGADSQCDVFALLRIGAQTCALTVEAKVNEPFDKMLGDWQTPFSDGKARRLAGLCDLLEIDPPPAQTRYQLIHRTAAAIIEARRFKTDRAAMIIQSFAADHRWHADFAQFAGLFGLDVPPGTAATVVLPSGLPLTLGWATGVPAAG